MKESVVFYMSYYEAIKELPEEYQIEMLDVIMDYAIKGKQPDTASAVVKAVFKAMKPNIDNAQKRYDASVENGKKGGRPKKETKEKPKENLKKPNNNQKKPKQNLNVYDNEDVNDNDNDNEDVNDNVEILDLWERQFEQFYEQYPKKVKKKDVKKWFEKNQPSNELFSSMLNSLEQFRASSSWQKDGGQYIPYPTSWLNQKRWEDEDITQGGIDDFKQLWEEAKENEQSRNYSNNNNFSW